MIWWSPNRNQPPIVALGGQPPIVALESQMLNEKRIEPKQASVLAAFEAVRSRKFACYFFVLALSLFALAACDAPGPTAVPGDTIFSDDFSQDSGLWETFDEGGSASAAISDGRMVITVNTPSTVGFTFAAINVSDFKLMVTSTQLSGSLANGYGVIYHYLDENNFYRFDISGDGQWALSRRQNEQWIPIVTLTPSPAIHTGYEANRLQIVVRGSNFEFYANDTLLGTVSDSNLTLGRIGLFASTFDEASTQVAFDDLKIVNP